MATMAIPTTLTSSTAEKGTKLTRPDELPADSRRPRDLFDYLLTLEDEKMSELARQFAKLLALGAPPDLFWHVHSLAGGAIPDNVMESLDNVRDFLSRAREEAGISRDQAKQMLSDVKRCMMTDLMEFESRLLQGLTATDAINHVVDFMAHVSTVHDALVASFVALEPNAFLSSNDASILGKQQGHVPVERVPTEPLSHSDAGNLATTNEPGLDETVNRGSGLLTELPEAKANSTSFAMNALLHPSYNESYASIRSFLEKVNDTYSGTGGFTDFTNGTVHSRL
jgi:hypothetical protein